jgi:hypothetical protein
MWSAERRTRVRLDAEAAARLEALYQFIDAIGHPEEMLVLDRSKLRRLARSHVVRLCEQETAVRPMPASTCCSTQERTSRRVAYALRFRAE